MSQFRNTRSGSKKASGISENFLALAQGSYSLAPDPSSLPPPVSPIPTSYAIPSGRQSGEDGDEGGQVEDFVPAGREDPNPDYPGDPDQNPDDNRSDSDEPEPQSKDSLAQTLRLLAEKIGDMSKPPKPRSKVQQRVPDVFDGSDPSKLDTFTFQVSMYISSRKVDFPDDEAKVAFALSYLKGIPLDWFQGEVARAMNDDGNFPVWFDDFPAFIAELRRLFGPRDPVNDATNAIEALRYKDSTKAARYTIDFNRHAHRTGWNNTALTRQYYKGLPDRLKDEIARLGKPAELSALQDLVSTLDQRYWERQSEISRDKCSTASNTTSQNKSTSSDNRTNPPNANASKSTINNQQSKNKKKPQPAAQASGSGNKTNNISDMLGPDGKLKPEERQRRMDNNLCLRCAKPGHKVHDCPVTSKVKPKGRAATVSAAPAASAPAASGKA